MGRTHHRKKHKENLRQFKQSHDSTTTSKAVKKGKSTRLFTIIGGAIGLGVTYFASLTWVWLIVGVVTGLIAGYVVGNKIEKS